MGKTSMLIEMKRAEMERDGIDLSPVAKLKVGRNLGRSGKSRMKGSKTYENGRGYPLSTN
jgi:hypothetical protein